MQTQSNKLNFERQKIFIGMDVHKKEWKSTDKRDCRKIARSLSNNELEAIHIPEKKTQEDRSLIRMRLTLRRDLTSEKNRVKSMLNFYGVDIPERFQDEIE